MNSNNKKTSFELRRLLKSIGVWLVAALLLLLISSVIISAADLKASSFGYFSSAVSFLSAFAAGLASSRGKADFTWITGLLFGAVMTVFLLMIGFLVAGNQLSADGVISVAAFTLSGSLLGSFLASASSSRRRKSTLHPQRKRIG